MSNYSTIQSLKEENDVIFLEACAEARELLTHQMDKVFSSSTNEVTIYSPPTSRNINNSILYGFFVDLIFLKKVSEKFKIKVIINSPVLRPYLPGVDLKINWWQYIFRKIKAKVRFLRNTLKFIKINFYAKRIGVDLEFLKNNPGSIFVDTYLTEGSFRGGQYSDRYFGEFFNYFSSEDLRKTIIWGSLVSIDKFQSLKRDVKNFLAPNLFLKEKLLNFKDILGIIKDVAKISFFKNSDFSASQYQPLFNEDCFMSGPYYLSFEALVSKKSFHKFLKLNLKPQVFLNWHENHLYDRALIKEYSKVKRPGFILKSYQCCLQTESEFFINPTLGELQSGLVPKVLYFAGPDHIKNDQIKNKISYKRVPLFRMQKIIQNLDDPELLSKKESYILVALPMNRNMAISNMEVVSKLASQNPDQQFKIRFHPLTIFDIPNIANVKLDKEVNSIDSISKAKLLLSSASSVCFEARCLGTCTIIIRNKGIPPSNPVPMELRKNWVFEMDETEEGLNDFKKIISNANEGNYNKELILTYLQKATRQSVVTMLSSDEI